MHDAISAERVGTPGIGIMTDAFVSGAELMASALGLAGYPFVVIDHPVASATDAQLEARARATLAQSATLLGLT